MVSEYRWIIFKYEDYVKGWIIRWYGIFDDILLKGIGFIKKGEFLWIVIFFKIKDFVFFIWEIAYNWIGEKYNFLV